MFDVYILWTNASDPECDPFEFAGFDMRINFNPALYGSQPVPPHGVTGGITGSKIAISGGINFPAELQCPNYIVRDTRILACGLSLSPDLNFMVSSTYPGNRMIRVKIRTNENQFPLVYPDLRFILEEPDRTQCFYFSTQMLPGGQEIKALPDTIDIHYTTESNFTLPVELESFTSEINRNSVILNWTTASEVNNSGFDIERKSADSDQWTKISFVNGKGNSDQTGAYTFSERLSTGKYNYRLKQIDFNGNSEFFALNNEVVVGIPSAYFISQNYPNPFNPSTKIDYELPFVSKVIVTLYDISGREVSVLVNESKSPGYYTVNVNGSSLSSGMYFYRINAEGNDGKRYSSTKKMMLVK